MNCWKSTGWLVLVALGCAGSQEEQRTEPHDMSASGHDESAGAEQAEASKHAGRYDPAALICRPGVLGTAEIETPGTGICWTSFENPTSHHLADAARHREIAEQHRAAAQSLREAESKACDGLVEADRVTSPFYHREDIAGVQKVETTVQPQRGQVQTTQLAGAKAVFRTVPGLTEQKLQRLVDCHMARAAALGHEIPDMDYCPLVLKNIQALVSATDDGFAVQVMSNDPATAKEIVRRMMRQTPERPPAGP